MKPVHPDIRILPRHPWKPDRDFMILHREPRAWVHHRTEDGKLPLWTTRHAALRFLIDSKIIDPLNIGANGALTRTKPESSNA